MRAGVTGAAVDAVRREVIERRRATATPSCTASGTASGSRSTRRPSLGREQRRPLPGRRRRDGRAGVYVPGLGGVRIEDMVEVTDDGCRVARHLHRAS